MEGPSAAAFVASSAENANPSANEGRVVGEDTQRRDHRSARPCGRHRAAEVWIRSVKVSSRTAFWRFAGQDSPTDRSGLSIRRDTALPVRTERLHASTLPPRAVVVSRRRSIQSDTLAIALRARHNNRWYRAHQKGRSPQNRGSLRTTTLEVENAASISVAPGSQNAIARLPMNQSSGIGAGSCQAVPAAASNPWLSRRKSVDSKYAWVLSADAVSKLSGSPRPRMCSA